MFAAIGVFLFATTFAFNDTARSYVPVTLTADRAGLVMETNAKVMLRGVQVGRVSDIGDSKNVASLRLEIEPDQVRYIPAKRAGADQRYHRVWRQVRRPRDTGGSQSCTLSAGAVLHSKNVATEINTVFENVVDLLKTIDPLKLNAVLDRGGRRSARAG